jgi:hypothetical protein
MLYPRPRSAAGFALRVYVERIDRVAGRHEQAIALQAAETEIGAAFRQGDEADRLAGRIEDFHSILLRSAHPPTAPELQETGCSAGTLAQILTELWSLIGKTT